MLWLAFTFYVAISFGIGMSATVLAYRWRRDKDDVEATLLGILMALIWPVAVVVLIVWLPFWAALKIAHQFDGEKEKK